MIAAFLTAVLVLVAFIVGPLLIAAAATRRDLARPAAREAFHERRGS